MTHNDGCDRKPPRWVLWFVAPIPVLTMLTWGSVCLVGLYLALFGCASTHVRPVVKPRCEQVTAQARCGLGGECEREVVCGRRR